MYYLQSRYYDPNTGRFINADDTSVLQATQGDLLGANLFAYCGNNPVMNSDPSGMLSFAGVLSVFQAILSVIGIVMNFVVSIATAGLLLYTGLDCNDISAIAKDIGRSPHRVRQAIERLTKKLSSVKSKLGKIAIVFGIMSLLAYLGSQFSKIGDMAKLIASVVVDGLVAGISFILENVAKALTKLIPVVGVFLSPLVGFGSSLLLNWIFSSSYVSAIKDRFLRKINFSTFKPKDFVSAFFSSF